MLCFFTFPYSARLFLNTTIPCQFFRPNLYGHTRIHSTAHHPPTVLYSIRLTPASTSEAQRAPPDYPSAHSLIHHHYTKPLEREEKREEEEPALILEAKGRGEERKGLERDPI